MIIMAGASKQPDEAMTDDEDVLAQLDRDRDRNDLKLKSRFEHIFRKYERDFTGVGDEFDIHTNEIVVNNGHLQHMRNENDPGKAASASSRFLTNFQHELEREVTSGDDDDVDGSGDYVDDGEDSEDDGDAESQTEAALQPYYTRDNRPALPRLAQLLMGNGTEEQPFEVHDDDQGRAAGRSDTTAISSVASTPAPLLEHMPGLGSAMSSLTSAKAPQRGADMTAISALGTQIANQLAKMMDVKRKERAKKPASTPVYRASADPAWDFPLINSDKARKRKRTLSPPPQPLLFSPPRGTPEYGSIWAEEEPVQPGKRRRRTRATAKADAELAVRRFGNTSDTPEAKRCWNCSLTRTPRWSKGPHGQDLCAGCGAFYGRNGRMPGMDSATPSGDEQQTPVPDDDPAPDLVDAPNLEQPNHIQAEEPPPLISERVQQSLPETLPALSGPGHQNISDFSPASLERTRHSTPRSLQAQPARAQTRSPYVLPALPGRVRQGTLCPAVKRELSQTPRPSYSANTSRHMTPSSLPTAGSSRWTAEEEYSIIMLKEHEKLTWDDIARRLPGRNAFACQARYSTKLHNRQCEARDLYNARTQGPKNAGSSTPTSSWTEQQDAMLMQLRDQKRLSWSEIAKRFPPRTTEDMEARYQAITAVKIEQYERAMSERQQTVELEDAQLYSPSRKHLHFRAEEDALIVRLKEVDGLGWSSIARRFQGRGMYSLQKRYANFLSPDRRRTVSTVKTDPVRGTMEDRIVAVDAELVRDVPSDHVRRAWTSDEDEQIKAQRDEQGLGWEEIAVNVSGRTADMVRHRYEYISANILTPYAPTREATPIIWRHQSVTPGVSSPGLSELSPAAMRATPHVQQMTTHVNHHETPQPSYAHGTSTGDSAPWQPYHEGQYGTETGGFLPQQECASRFGSLTPDPTVLTPEDDYKRRFTAEEDEKIVRLRESGMGWSQMTIHIPGRTAASLATRFNQGLAKGKLRIRRSLPTSLSSIAQASGTDLLRQAVGNRLRRHPDHPHQSRPNNPHTTTSTSRTLPQSRLQEAATVETNLDVGDDPISYDEEPSSTSAGEQLNQEMLQASSPTSIDRSVDYGHPGLVESSGTTASPPAAANSALDRRAETPPTQSFRARRPGRRSTASLSVSTKWPTRAQQSAARPDSPPAHEVSAASLPQAPVQSTDDISDDASLANPHHIRQKPQIGTDELICKAFEASDSPILHCKNLYAWFEDHYEYFRSTTANWKGAVRRELANNSSFVSAGEPGKRRSGLWRMVQTPQTPPEEDIVIDVPVSSDARQETMPDQARVTSNPAHSTGNATRSPPKTASKSTDRRVTFDERVRVKGTGPGAGGSKRKRNSSLPSPNSYLRSALKNRRQSEGSDDEIIIATPSALRLSPRGSPERTHLLAKFKAVARPESSKAEKAASTSSDMSMGGSKPRNKKRRVTMPASSAPASQAPAFVKPSTPASDFRTPDNTIRARSRVSTGMINTDMGSPAIKLPKRVVETPLRELQDPDEDELA